MPPLLVINSVALARGNYFSFSQAPKRKVAKEKGAFYSGPHRVTQAQTVIRTYASCPYIWHCTNSSSTLLFNMTLNLTLPNVKTSWGFSWPSVVSFFMKQSWA
jgi:hypothetical protein